MIGQIVSEGTDRLSHPIRVGQGSSSLDPARPDIHQERFQFGIVHPYVKSKPLNSSR
jgi:hypothetical protein